MAEFTTFNAIAPIITEAKPETVYDRYWLYTMVIRAPSPKDDARLSAVFKLYNADTREFAPNADQVNIDIGGLFTEAASNPKIAQAMELVFQALKEKLDLKLNPPVVEPEIPEVPVVEPVIPPPDAP